MEIARSVEQERRNKVPFVFAIELLDQTWRRREAQPWSPCTRVNQRKAQWLIAPRVIQIEMKSAADQKLVVRFPKKLGVARFGDAQIFLGFLVTRIKPQCFTKLDDGL